MARAATDVIRVVRIVMMLLRSRGNAANSRRRSHPKRTISIMSTCSLMFVHLWFFRLATWISLSKWPMLPTIAMSFISRMCSMRMTSLLPVVVMKMSASGDHVFQRHDLEAVHRGLQRADRVDLRHLHARARAAQRRGRPLADVAVAHDDRDLARHHGVGGAADAVDERFLAAVLVVELRLGDAVVHVDRGEGQLALALCSSYRRCTPVVVSSDTPLIASRTLVNQPGLPPCAS